MEKICAQGHVIGEQDILCPRCNGEAVGVPVEEAIEQPVEEVVESTEEVGQPEIVEDAPVEESTETEVQEVTEEVPTEEVTESSVEEVTPSVDGNQEVKVVAE